MYYQLQDIQSNLQLLLAFLVFTHKTSIFFGVTLFISSFGFLTPDRVLNQCKLVLLSLRFLTYSIFINTAINKGANGEGERLFNKQLSTSNSLPIGDFYKT